jgi:hypothetical protein
VRHVRGFTLFEVLAAALVLVLVGTITIGSMNRNLAHLGDARQRLEAGRIADAALADLEATLFDGSAPPLSASEEEVGAFRVKTRVVPFGVLFDAEEVGADEDAEATSLFSVIAQELPGLPQHLRVIDVHVEWGDPMAPDFVERTTVAFDRVAATEAIQQRTGLDGGEDEG